MGTLYLNSGGSATNSGSTDTNSASLSGSAATNASTVVTLDGSPDLSGIVTSGANQSSIYLAQATNTNKKIFWITAFDDTLNTVTVDTAPTGVTSSAWAIGGRISTPMGASVLRAGDELVLTSDISGTTALSLYVTGTVDNPVTVRGDSPTSRRTFTITNTQNCVALNASKHVCVKDLIFEQQGASGTVVTTNSNAAGISLENVKIRDGGGVGVVIGTSGCSAMIVNCEISGVGSNGITAGILCQIASCYIHDNSADGIAITGTNSTVIVGCTIERNTAKGINISGAISLTTVNVFSGNTVYLNGSDGIYLNSGVLARFLLLNNIFKDNGNAGSEYNLNSQLASINIFSRGNVYSISGGLGGGNLNNFTEDASDLTSDPLFVDPDNGSSASRNFNLGSTSPAKAAGYSKVPGSGTTSYLDIGAAQRQEPHETRPPRLQQIVGASTPEY